MAMPAAGSGYWHGKHQHPLLLSWLLTQGGMFVAQTMGLGVFTGAMLLQVDFPRGLVRVAALLPLTSRQVGRSWWLASVAAPAALQIVMLFVGAGAFHGFHPGLGFGLPGLLWCSLVIFIWFGLGFNIYFTNYTLQRLPGNWRRRLWQLLVTALMLWMLFGFALSLEAQKNPVKWAIFLGAGLTLTLVGWWQAGQFSLASQFGRAGAKPLAAMQDRFRKKLLLTPLSVKSQAEPPPAADGSGGISLLIRTNFHPAFWFCMLIVVCMLVALALEGAIKSWQAALELAANLVAAYWVICFACFASVLRELRYLRTLPLASGRLALVLVLAALLPLVATGALIAGVACLSTDTGIGLLVLKNFTLILAPASLCLAAATWRGVGVAYAVVIPSLIGFEWVCFRDIPLSTCGIVAAGSVLLAILIVGHNLRHSHHAYRAPATSFLKSPWDTPLEYPRSNQK
jgi:hypothetical protein